MKRTSFPLGALVISGFVVLAQMGSGCASTSEDDQQAAVTESSYRQPQDLESQLRELRISPREVRESEMLSSLSGRASGTDSGHAPSITSDDSLVAGGHLSYGRVLPVLTTYREVFKEPRLDPATGGPAIDPATGERLCVDRDREIRGALTAALRRFRGEAAAGTLDPIEFRRFLESAPEESAALGHVEALEEFFRQLHLLGLGPKVEEKCRRTNLARVCPNGLRVQQLEEIILAQADGASVSMLR